MVRELDFEEIRKQVAIQHNVLLGKDDPILVTVTVNDMVLTRHLDVLSERCDEAQKSLAVHLQHQVDQAKETAGKLITDAADYVAIQVREVLDVELADAFRREQQQLAEVRRLTEIASATARETQQAKRTVFWIALMSAVLAIAAATVLLIASLTQV